MRREVSKVCSGSCCLSSGCGSWECGGSVAAPAAFVLQELVERFLHDGHLHWHFVVTAPFFLGLATQVPFALLAAAIAFVLANAARHVAQAIRAARRPRPRGTALTFLSWLSADLPSAPVLARGYTGRGPPLLA